jgi:hypothetical protein
MKLYATIDGGTIVASIEKSFLPNDNWQEYEVDYVDQLVIVNNQIVVDKTQPNKIEVYKQQGRDRNRFGELSQIISDYVADKELYNNGIIDSMSITEEEYRNILIEYKSLKDKLS